MYFANLNINDNDNDITSEEWYDVVRWFSLLPETFPSNKRLWTIRNALFLWWHWCYMFIPKKVTICFVVLLAWRYLIAGFFLIHKHKSKNCLRCELFMTILSIIVILIPTNRFMPKFYDITHDDLTEKFLVSDHL